MANSEYNVLDTRAFDKFIAESPNLVERYNKINEEYDNIVKTLLDNWVGEGAESFRDDAKKVKANISGINDILNIMCNTLSDCRDIFGECDTALAEVNRNPGNI